MSNTIDFGGIRAAFRRIEDSRKLISQGNLDVQEECRALSESLSRASVAELLQFRRSIGLPDASATDEELAAVANAVIPSRLAEDDWLRGSVFDVLSRLDAHLAKRAATGHPRLLPPGDGWNLLIVGRGLVRSLRGTHEYPRRLVPDPEAYQHAGEPALVLLEVADGVPIPQGLRERRWFDVENVVKLTRRWAEKQRDERQREARERGDRGWEPEQDYLEAARQCYADWLERQTGIVK